MRIATVRTVVKDHTGKKVLLCKSLSTDHYFLPGGGIELQELAEEAIVREFKEEMGVEKEDIVINDFIGIMEIIYNEKDGTKKHGINIVFDVSLKNEDVQTKEPDNIEFVWQDIDKLEEINLKPQESIEVIRNGARHVVSIQTKRGV